MSDDVVNRFNLSGDRVLVVRYDEYSPNPRTEYDTFGRLFCFHRRYNLGDKHDYRSEDYAGWGEFLEQLRKDFDIAVVLPVFMMDHSGLSVSTSDDMFRACDLAGWDWGMIGWCFCERSDVLKNFGGDDEKAKQCLRAEIELYNQFVSGDCYMYSIVSRCEHCSSEMDVVDSCGGFFGRDIATNGILDHLNEKDREAVKEQLCSSKKF